MCVPLLAAAAIGGAGFLAAKAFSGGKSGSLTPPTSAPLPTPAPLPTVSASQSSMQDNQAAARNRLKYGLASTIKTNQTPTLLNTTNQGKNTLG